ncbi:MAG: IS66 family transposase [Acidobacteria bacterium]|nr:IS66 family transposase [Acidobacteriota bacterium]
MESELLTSSKTKIPPEDWALTPPSVQQALRQVLDRVAALEEELSRLRIENEQLREQTRRSSRNSSQPPSLDTPDKPPWRQRKSSGKKRGAQPGHEGHQRKLYPPEECRSVSDHRPTKCRDCGAALSGDDPHPRRHQVVELPAAPPLVDEHRLHQLTCPDCGEATRANLPVGVPACGYGPRLAAAVGVRGGKYRQSDRQTQELLEDFFHVEVALGTVNNLRQEVCEALAAPVAEATAFAQEEEAANMDETGWRQGNSDGNNPTRRKAWVWVLVTSWVTVFQVHLSRGQASARELLGEFSGYLITDRWTGYGWWPLARRQLCWAHLIREFQKIADRGDESRKIGDGLLAQARKLFELWHRVRDGTLTREGFAAAVKKIREAVGKCLTEGASYEAARGDHSARARTARTCQELLKVEPAFWLFVRVAGIEPTNNAAERALRPAVIWRRISLGTQSSLGSQFVARMLTVTQTLRSQQRPLLEFVTTACEAARFGKAAPSLLPDLSVLEEEHHLAKAA